MLSLRWLSCFWFFFKLENCTWSNFSQVVRDKKGTAWRDGTPHSLQFCAVPQRAVTVAEDAEMMRRWCRTTMHSSCTFSTYLHFSQLCAISLSFAQNLCIIASQNLCIIRTFASDSHQMMHLVNLCIIISQVSWTWHCSCTQLNWGSKAFNCAF